MVVGGLGDAYLFMFVYEYVCDVCGAWEDFCAYVRCICKACVHGVCV